jgi:hypothetical protein
MKIFPDDLFDNLTYRVRPYLSILVPSLLFVATVLILLVNGLSDSS